MTRCRPINPVKLRYGHFVLRSILAQDDSTKHPQTIPMEHTLTLETRALKAANRQWKELSPEVQRMINMRTLFVHRTAPLIKDLEFTRLPEENHRGIYWPARLRVTGATFLRQPVWTWRGRIERIFLRDYMFSDFGDAAYDRYQIGSDDASGIFLGRVAGTERRGHEP